MKSKIDAKNICLSYAEDNGSYELNVLENISFVVQEGALISILGPSGCGKTTLLKIIAGLIPPTNGMIYADNKPIVGPSSDRTVIFQDYGLFEWKTVEENVRFGLKAKGIPKDKREHIAQKFIEMVHLQGSESKYPGNLSGGMKQRAAIARAFAVEPDCVLMDEPFAALDSQTRQLLQEDILEIWEKTKKTILLVTHNVEEAVFLSDRIIMLSHIPAQLILDINVDLPRPRDPNMRFNDRFHEIVDQVWHSLREQVIPARQISN